MKTIDKKNTTFTKPTLMELVLCSVVFGWLFALATTQAADNTKPSFYLKDGDRVCFYGDSITEQRYYGLDVEAYVRTRFPHLRVKFVNSGVGGDRVGGGWAGGVDLRLKRDVFPFKPNVVTIMLGMNDAEYRPFDAGIFGIYTNGYEHLVESLQAHLPGVRIVLIQPSPYDDVTETPKFPGGYNAVLLRYSAFVRQLAATHHLLCVDLNQPLVDVMKKVLAQNPKLAHEVIPGRVHPSAAGELVMAQGILQAWNAPATVTSVTIDATRPRVIHAENTSVTNVKTVNGILSWTQNDRCLPFPILALHNQWWHFPPVERSGGSLTFFAAAPEIDWNYTNAATAMIVKDSGFYQALNQEPLQVTGLQAGNYRLKINSRIIGEFSARELGAGVNLAEHKTPMLEQSYRVLHLVWQQVQWRYFAWRGIQNQLWFDRDPAVQKSANSLIAALEKQKEHIVKQQYAAAQPRPTHYELIKVAPAHKAANSAAALPSVPTGLQVAGGYGLVSLNWAPSAEATSYQVKRSTRSGTETILATITTTNYTDREVANGKTYYYTVSAANLQGRSSNSHELKATPEAPEPGSYAAAVVADHPVAYWPLAETNGPVAFDLVGGHNGIYVGDVAFVQPKTSVMGCLPPRHAVHFDGVSSYVNIPKESLNLTNAITIVVWVNIPVAPRVLAGIMGHGNGSWRMVINSSGKPGASNGHNDDATGPIRIPGGGWHMVAYTYTGVPNVAGNGSLYLDGAPVAYNTIRQPASDNHDVWIGGSPDYGTERLFSGCIAQAAVFNNTLSPAQVLALYRAWPPRS